PDRPQAKPPETNGGRCPGTATAPSLRTRNTGDTAMEMIRSRTPDRPPKDRVRRMRQAERAWLRCLRSDLCRAAVGTCRLNAEAKAFEATTFSLEAGAHTWVIPTKLVGTRRHQ